MKNWLLPVLGPLFAMATDPMTLWCLFGSSSFIVEMLGSPCPVPVGSPPWMIEDGMTLWNIVLSYMPSSVRFTKFAVVMGISSYNAIVMLPISVTSSTLVEDASDGSGAPGLLRRLYVTIAPMKTRNMIKNTAILLLSNFGAIETSLKCEIYKRIELCANIRNGGPARTRTGDQQVS